MEQNEEQGTDVIASVTPETAEDSATFTADLGDDDIPTVEDYKKAMERLQKAEKKLVELKKANKEASLKESEELVEAKLAERDFYRDNPEFKEYKEEVSAYVKKGLSFEEAAAVVKAKDPAFGNREKAKAASLSGGEAGSTKSVYTAAELAKMTQVEYNTVKALQAQGKVTFKR